MKKVEMINRVPLPNADGTSYLPLEGDECVVTTSIAEALKRGGDANIIGDVKTETIAEVAAAPVKEATEEKSAPKASTKKKKNRGAAPENKAS